jgi:glutathione S-transferase
MPNPELALYWFPGTCSRVSLIALEETGAPYERVLVRKFDPEATAEYSRDVSAKGKVPALIADGKLITENTAIVFYLHQRFPHANVLPSDPGQLVDAVSTMVWFGSEIHPAIGRARHPRLAATDPAAGDAIKATALQQLHELFGQVDERLAGREWLFDEWSAVDGYLLWLWFRGVGNGLKGEDFPSVDAHARRCQQRASATKILNLEESENDALVEEGAMPPRPGLAVGWLPA